MDKINRSKPDLTKSERLVANYVQENPKDVELYTIVKIAENTGTSKSAVFRFCQKLDYQGYSEFRYEMINFLHQNKTENEIVNSAISASLSLFEREIKQLEMINPILLDEIINQIILANQVYCIGVYKSGVVAQKLAYNFMNCGKEVFLINDMLGISHLPYHIKENSLILIFSVSGTSTQLSDFLKSNNNIAQQAVLISSNKRSKISHLVKSSLILPSNELIESLIDPHAIYIIFVELLTQLYQEKINLNRMS